jgi:hypothetical protein
MKLSNALSAVLACAVSTLVAVWLVCSTIDCAFEALGPANQDVLMIASMPWLGAKPVQRVRRLEPVTVVGHRMGNAIAAADAP